MHRRKTLALGLFTVVALSGGAAVGAAIAATLIPSNSVSYDLMTNSSELLNGTNCGATATVTKTLPPGSTDIKVVTPIVGERDSGGGKATQVTAVSVAGTVISFTALANGPNICDPALTGYGPGEDVPWSARQDLRAEYKRRIPTVIRVFYESYVFGAKWKSRPKKLQDSRAGTPRSVRERITGIKWRSFGGKKAVGNGTLHLDYCRSGDRCPENGRRIKLVASKPGYCKDSNQFEYLKLTTYVGKRARTGSKIECG